MWINLKDKYDHVKMTVLPQERFNWINLRLHDFKSFYEYNSLMFEIISLLRLYGETITDGNMLKKTFITSHALNVLLQ